MKFCEIDPYACISYWAIHNVDRSYNLGDVCNIEERCMPKFNMICGGSPCQDFSIVGEQAGSVWTCKKCGYTYNPITVHFCKRDTCPVCESYDLDKTRSSLLVEYLRLVRIGRPDFGIYENVRGIIGKKFRETFDLFLAELQEYGYHVYWQVLNAKDYGVPQSRERVYIVFVKQDLDCGSFTFPAPFACDVRLTDLLECEVDQKYFLNTKGKSFAAIDTSEISYCILATYYKGATLKEYFEKKA